MLLHNSDCDGTQLHAPDVRYCFIQHDWKVTNLSERSPWLSRYQMSFQSQNSHDRCTQPCLKLVLPTEEHTRLLLPGPFVVAVWSPPPEASVVKTLSN